jgi:hypothetical protein
MEPVYFSKPLELISKVRRASGQLGTRRFHSCQLDLLISSTWRNFRRFFPQVRVDALPSAFPVRLGNLIGPYTPDKA